MSCGRGWLESAGADCGCGCAGAASQLGDIDRTGMGGRPNDNYRADNEPRENRPGRKWVRTQQDADSYSAWVSLPTGLAPSVYQGPQSDLSIYWDATKDVVTDPKTWKAVGDQVGRNFEYAADLLGRGASSGAKGLLGIEPRKLLYIGGALLAGILLLRK